MRCCDQEKEEKEEMMSMSEDDDTTVYAVLKNQEEQYSLWLKCNEVPAGWEAVGKEGPKADCLQYIRESWTDMRPLSLRMKMDLDRASS
jgi:MbtH protein